MPGFDGTGPNGLGLMTGRGMGNCCKAQGCGRGVGPGLGRGRRGCFADSAESVSSQERIEALKAYTEKLKAEIETLEKKSI